MIYRTFLSLFLLISLSTQIYSKSISSKTNENTSLKTKGTGIFKAGSKPRLKISSHNSDIVIQRNENNDEFLVSGNHESFRISENNGNLTVKEHKNNNIADITIMAPVNTALNLTSKGGSITIEEGMKNISIETGNGNIKIERPTGDVTINNQSGKTEVDHPTGPVCIEGQSGNVTIKHPKADVSVTLSSGNINMQAKTLHPSQKFTLETTSGNITCALPKNTSSIGISTTSGKVYSNGFKYKTIGTWSDSNNYNLSLTATSGKVTLKNA